MKTAFGIIGIIVCLLMLANTSIQFKPFKVTFDTPFLAIGMAFIFVGIGFIQVQPHASAYQKGLDRGSEIAREAAMEVVRQTIEESKNK